jgi:hypothetical protein
MDESPQVTFIPNKGDVLVYGVHRYTVSVVNEAGTRATIRRTRTAERDVWVADMQEWTYLCNIYYE